MEEATADKMRSGITDVVDPGRTAGYAHDALDRLVGADGWWGNLDWTYDKTGNRLSETRDGTASTYAYEPGTSRLATVTGGDAHVLAYDASGNATRYDDLCLDYDAADRLVAIRKLVDPVGCGADRTGACSTCATTLVQESGYDWKLRRVRRVEHVNEDGLPLSTPRCTTFVHDLYDRLIAEHDCSAGSSYDPALNVLAEYVYLDGYHVLAARRGGQWYWYANDHLPTPRKLVDAAGAEVWDGPMEPFGATDEVVATMPQPLRFPGQVGDGGVDDRGLVSSKRWLAPSLGRFLQADPADLSFTVAPGVCDGMAAGDGQHYARRISANASPYSHAFNAPGEWWDYDGAFPIPPGWPGVSFWSNSSAVSGWARDVIAPPGDECRREYWAVYMRCAAVAGGVAWSAWRILCATRVNYWQSALCWVGGFIVPKPAKMMCDVEAEHAEAACRCRLAGG